MSNLSGSIAARGFFDRFGPFPRFYHLPLLSQCVTECDLCSSLGCRNETDRTLGDAMRALDRAQSGEFDAVIFPAHVLDVPYLDELLAICAERKLGVILQATAESLQARSNDEITHWLDQGSGLNVVFTGRQPPSSSLIALLEAWPGSTRFMLSVLRRDPVIATLKALPEFVQQRLHFHTSYHLTADDRRLSCRQVHALMERIRRELPSLEIRPQLGTEMWDPRIDSDLCLEPVIDPLFVSEIAGSELKVSVVIPSYNNRVYLKNTIAHLLRQDLPRENFEIIVVDDGSDDGSSDEVISQVEKESSRVNFKYLFSPRSKPREMGDANYRAGISRNLGVKNARGEILCFLDSDILTPSHFLSDLVEKHRQWDVIQCKRLNLKREVSTESVRFEEVNPQADIFHTDGGYWEEFHKVQDWASIQFHWKYVCTYGLSMRLETFKRIGWLKRNFIFYGFEDTELGYRLAKAGCSFHLNEMITYHLFHRNERSEFSNSDFLRHRLLAKTAQIFYRNLLDPDLFQHFRSYMNEEISLGAYLRVWAGQRLMRYLPRRATISPLSLDAGLGQARPRFVPLKPPQNRFARRLHLSIMSRCDRQCRFCTAIGCLHSTTRTLNEIKAILFEAKANRYEAVVFPPNATWHPEFKEILSVLRELGLRIVLQIHGFEFSDTELDDLDIEFELLLDRPLPSKQASRLASLSNRVHPVLFTFRDVDLAAISKSLPSGLRNRLMLFAPIRLESTSPFMSPDELNRWLESIRGLKDEFTLTPYRDPDRRLPSAWPGQGDPQMPHVLFSNPRRPAVSVIIPFRTDVVGLIDSLNSLVEQKIEQDLFEIIIVAAADTPEDIQVVVERLKKIPASVQLSLLRLVEAQGERQARPSRGWKSLSRDEGALSARGNLLVFLDSGVRVGPEFLGEVLCTSEKSDVVVFQDTNARRFTDVPRSIWKQASLNHFALRTELYFATGSPCPSFETETESHEALLFFWKLSRLDSVRWTMLECNSLQRPYSALRSTSSQAGSIDQRKQAARFVYFATLDQELYRHLFAELGEFTFLRESLKSMAENRTLRPLISALHFCLFVYHLDHPLDYFANIVRTRWIPRCADVIWWSTLHPAWEAVRSNRWRLDVATTRVSTHLKQLVWWSGIWPLLNVGRSNAWRMKVFGIRFFYPIWAELRGNAWRIRVHADRLRVHFMQVVWWTTLWRAWCATQGWIRANLWFFRSPIGWTRTKAPILYWVFIFPFLKAYYFSEYQWRTRIARVDKCVSLAAAREDLDAK